MHISKKRFLKDICLALFLTFTLTFAPGIISPVASIQIDKIILIDEPIEQIQLKETTTSTFPIPDATTTTTTTTTIILPTTTIPKPKVVIRPSTTTTAVTNIDASGPQTPNAFLVCIAHYESGSNYSSVGGGMYGIIDSTWNNLNYPFKIDSGVNHSWLATPAQQDAAAIYLYNRSGTKPWGPRRLCGG